MWTAEYLTIEQLPLLCRRRQLVLCAGPGRLGEQGVPLPGDLRQQPAGVPRRAKHSATRPRDLRRARVGPRPGRHLAGDLLRHLGLLYYGLHGMHITESLNNK